MISLEKDCSIPLQICPPPPHLKSMRGANYHSLHPLSTNLLNLALACPKCNDWGSMLPVTLCSSIIPLNGQICCWCCVLCVRIKPQSPSILVCVWHSFHPQMHCLHLMHLIYRLQCEGRHYRPNCWGKMHPSKSPMSDNRYWAAWHSLTPEMISKSFQKCGISNAMDGTDDDLILQEDQTTHPTQTKQTFMTILWHMNKLSS